MYKTLEKLIIEKGLDIQEALLEEEGLQLQYLVSKVARPGMLICEIGSWKGHSTAYLAEIAQKYNGLVFAVDTWQGSEGYQGTIHGEVRTKDIFGLFESNVKALGFNCVRPMVMKSLDAAAIMKDKLFDLVFIDADHSYQQISADIKAWLPKVRRGGIISGHDCECKYSAQPPYIRHGFDENINAGEQFLNPPGCHIGVIKALHDILHEKHYIFPGSRVWYWQKKLFTPNVLSKFRKIANQHLVDYRQNKDGGKLECKEEHICSGSD